MTFPSSLNKGRTNAPASCTASLRALIPVFMYYENVTVGWTKNQKMRSRLPLCGGAQPRNQFTPNEQIFESSRATEKDSISSKSLTRNFQALQLLLYSSNKRRT